MLKPVIICGTGRCGSTLLMQLLATSDKFFIPSSYPFESRFLYYLEALATMSTMENSTKLLADTILRDPTLKKIYSGILYHPFGLREFVNSEVMRVEIFRHFYIAFSKSILSESKKQNPPSYYAEKSMGFRVPDIFSHIYPVIINLFRDPRDILSSVMQFNQKRGYFSFAWTDTDTPFSYAKRMLPAYRLMLEKSKLHLEREFSIKYEDMVLKKDDITLLLKKTLNIHVNNEEVFNNIEQYRQHMTSKTAKLSVGKWKTNLDKSVLDLFDSELGEHLIDSGYELNG